MHHFDTPSTFFNLSHYRTYRPAYRNPSLSDLSKTADRFNFTVPLYHFHEIFT
jgi:hypothetical protein